MNKRIKKKRTRLRPRCIGNNVYTREEIELIIMNNLFRHWLIPRMYFTSLDPNKNGVHVWRKRNIKRALKYMYKHRNQYLSYKHLKFARHLKPKDEFILQKPPAIISEHRTILGGEPIMYTSTATFRFAPRIHDGRIISIDLCKEEN